MRKSPVSRLPLNTPLPFAVYHESGKRLHTFGEELSGKHAFLLQRNGIEEVFLADRLDRPARVEEDLKCREVELRGSRGLTIARPVYTEDGRLLVDSGTRINEDMLNFLTKAAIKSIVAYKRDDDLHLGQVTKYRRDLEKHIEGGEPIPGFGAQEGGADRLIQLARDLAVVSALEARGPEILRAKPTGEPLSKRLPPLDAKKVRTRAELDGLRSIYNSCVARIEAIFRELASGHEVTMAEIDALIGDMLKATLRDRAMLLAIMHQPRDGEYLFTHAVNVFTLVVNLAILLDFDERLLKETCYAALFNDVGMMLVPDSIRNKTGKLNDAEIAEVRNHTTYSVRLANKVDGIPEALPLVIFQSHELMDGSGYPRQRSDDQIHDLARVVAVADAYSAIISNRPYRRGEKPYRAIEEVIHLAGQRKYDPRVVRALLQTVNLFPVGSWVKMADGSSAVVVCPNTQEFARPYVRIIFDQSGQPVTGFPLVATADVSGVAIDRAIEAPRGISALLAFFKAG